MPEGDLLPVGNTLTVELPGDTGVDFDLVDVDGFTVEYPRHLVARSGSLDFTGAGASFEVQGLPSGDIVVYRQNGDAARAAGRRRWSTEAARATTPVTFPGLAAGGPLPGGERRRRSRYPVSRRRRRRVRSAAALPRCWSSPIRTSSTVSRRWCRQREAQGWSVKVVDVEDVYAEFGGDIFDPAAIRDYITFAVANLETEAVLLVGGDTYDYRNYLGFGGMSFLPSLYTAERRTS